MNIHDSLDNLKKTEDWGLICNNKNIELIMLTTKNSDTFEDFILKLFQLNDMKCTDKKLLQKTILISRFPNMFMSSDMSEYETDLYTRSFGVGEASRTNDMSLEGFDLRKNYCFDRVMSLKLLRSVYLMRVSQIIENRLD